MVKGYNATKLTLKTIINFELNLQFNDAKKYFIVYTTYHN